MHAYNQLGFFGAGETMLLAEGAPAVQQTGVALPISALTGRFTIGARTASGKMVGVDATTGKVTEEYKIDPTTGQTVAQKVSDGNTMFWVAGGLAAAGLLWVALSKKKSGGAMAGYKRRRRRR